MRNLIRSLMLRLDIPPYRISANIADSPDIIPARPQTTPPETLPLQLRESSKHRNSARRLKQTNNIRDRIRRLQLHEQMHMIRHHLKSQQTPIISLTHLHQKTTHKPLNTTNKNRMTILRTPHQMIPKPTHTMRRRTINQRTLPNLVMTRTQIDIITKSML